MEIGDKVIIKSYVARVKKHFPGKTWGEYKKVPLGWPGTVVGKVAIYDYETWMEEGYPVTSRTNRRNAYLVATTMGKRYRCLEEDLSSLDENASNIEEDEVLQIGQFQQQASSGRTDPDPADVEQWVVDALNTKVGAKAEFTAFDITREIRAAQPATNVRHDEVRSLVHMYMATMIAGGLYTSEDRDYSGNIAITFVPEV